MFYSLFLILFSFTQDCLAFSTHSGKKNKSDIGTEQEEAFWWVMSVVSRRDRDSMLDAIQEHWLKDLRAD